MSSSARHVLLSPAARRSDRVSLVLPIQAAGDDGDGRAFVETGHTILLSRHGAKIALARKLVPEQEITVTCLATGKEAVARVVGQTGEEGRNFAYGIVFEDEEVNPWDIDFPPLAESEKAAGRVLAECLHCRRREVAYLNEVETEIMESSHRLSRACQRCGGSSLWHAVEEPEAGAEPAAESPAAPSANAAAIQASPLRAEAAKQPASVGMRVRACIRHPQLGDEAVTTERISRSGVTFKSARHYSRELPLQIAVPYLSHGANIFSPAEIQSAEFLPDERLTLYSVAYIPMHRGWPPPKRSSAGSAPS